MTWLHRELVQRLQAGEHVARATLVRAWGSTPREVGAQMLVLRDGSIVGTVGGGCGEAEVWQCATRVLESGQACRVEVDLTEDQSSDSGKVCGGRFEVFIDFWSQLPPNHPLSWDTSGCLITYLGPAPQRNWQSRTPALVPLSNAWTLGESRYFATRSPLLSDPLSLTLEGQDFFLQPLGPGPELVIAGAGHIARPLSRMATLCGFRVKIVDDRADYARPQDFPEAEVTCCEFSDYFGRYQANPKSYIVLITRGHKHDQNCLRQLRQQQPAYLGMIGSQRRTRAVLDELQTEGFSPRWLEQIKAPVGLDIGAQTPEEIAIAILAEIIQQRRGGGGTSLSSRPKAAFRQYQ